MPKTMTKKQRVLACVRWEDYDRVPIYPPVPFRPSDWYRDNCIQYIESGLKYGEL